MGDPALINPYCSVEDVQAFIGNTDEAKQAVIANAINSASRFIDSITGMVFYKLTVTSYAIPGTGGGDGWSIRAARPGVAGGGIIVCPYRPIITVTSIVESGVTLVENTDFYVIPGEGIIERAGGSWASGPREVVISASFGYAQAAESDVPTGIPGDIKQFAKEIAGRMTGLFLRTIEQPDGSETSFYETTIPKWMVERLKARALV